MQCLVQGRGHAEDILLLALWPVLSLKFSKFGAGWTSCITVTLRKSKTPIDFKHCIKFQNTATLHCSVQVRSQLEDILSPWHRDARHGFCLRLHLSRASKRMKWAKTETQRHRHDTREESEDMECRAGEARVIYSACIIQTGALIKLSNFQTLGLSRG